MGRLHVMILFGGMSEEHAVSIKSAAELARNLDRDKYEPIYVYIGTDGLWRPASAPGEGPGDAMLDVACDDAVVVPSTDRRRRGFMVLRDGRCEALPVDVAFPMLHGRYGEDGAVQGLLELAGIPYVGCGIAASSLCMDKALTYLAASAVAVDVPRHWVLHEGEGIAAVIGAGDHGMRENDDSTVNGSAMSGFHKKDSPASGPHENGTTDDVSSENGSASTGNGANAAHGASPHGATDGALGGIAYPVFVKPARSGSSFGVTKVGDPAGLATAIREARRYDGKVLIEEAIVGSEIGCAVLGNRGGLVMGALDQIDVSSGFFRIHQEQRPEQGSQNATIRVPAAVTADVRERVLDAAQRVYRALGCRGLARVDLFVTREGRVVLNEVNSMPGMTSYSRYPRMMAAAGIPLSQVVDRLIEMAVAGDSESA